ncbi:YciI family protein [Rhodococcus kronopolitis]|uniref:YciI family protein n=1 Tax=Rhodococcus kronopolitis TaxID=1460226 RepID=A0ABV9FRN6_9NOCA
MPLFAVQYTYSASTSDRRDVVRPEHRGWLADGVESGVLVSVGPYPDGSGALIVGDAADETAMLALLAQDPFARDGLIDAVRCVEWNPIMGLLSDR